MTEDAVEYKLDNQKGEYCIVKYAAEHVWQYYYLQDPKFTGVLLDNSAYHSHTGKSVGIDLSYTDKEKAEVDLAKMIEANPSVGYALCKVRHNQNTLGE